MTAHGVNSRLPYWIASLYDHPKLTPAHRDILICLAVRKLDYSTGTGYCSVETLAKGTGRHEATVKKALRVARGDPPLLEQTRRGHHIADGKAVASEWRLIYPELKPTLPGYDVGTGPTSHQDDVGTGPTSFQVPPNVVSGATQRRLRHPLTDIESPTDNESPSSAHPAAADAIRAAVPDVTDAEIGFYIAKIIKERRPASPDRYIAAIKPESIAAAVRRARGRRGCSPRPPWCGVCDEHTRQLELPDDTAARYDTAARCPDCHPESARAAS